MISACSLNYNDILDNSDMSLCSDGFATDASSSLDSDLYRGLASANLLDNFNPLRQQSVDSFGEGPSYSRLFASLPPPPIQSQNRLVTQIGRMRREMPESSYLSRKGKEPVRPTENVSVDANQNSRGEFFLD